MIQLYHHQNKNMNFDQLFKHEHTIGTFTKASIDIVLS